MLVGMSTVGPNEGMREGDGPTIAPGQLVVVATPIGNLGDLSARALEVLLSADVVYCEDTRRSRTLFSAHGATPRRRLQTLHEHNENATSVEVIERVARGELVALVSDAGTPGISDPGARVVAAVLDAGLTVSTVPGPSALIAALSISGLPTERFVMEGFMARKAGERVATYESWRHEGRTVVFYESPQRLTTTLDELAGLFPSRRVAVARELTKVHEEVLRGTLAQVAATLRGREVLGEVVVVLDGVAERARVSDEVVAAALDEGLARGLTVRDAVALVVAELGVSHRETYALALRRRVEGGS